MSSSTLLGTNLVRLQRAVLCADCEIISETKDGHCASCGSQALLGLSRVLGGSLQLCHSFRVSESLSPAAESVRVPQFASDLKRPAWACGSPHSLGL